MSGPDSSECMAGATVYYRLVDDNEAAIQERHGTIVAAIRNMGGLVVDDTLEPIGEIGSAEVNAALEIPAHSFLADVWPQPRGTARSVLEIQGIETARDLLVLGEDRLRKIDSIGPQAIASIKHYLALPPLWMELQERPTAEDAARLCEDISQVSVHVLTIGRGFENARSPLPGQSNRLTVADALARTRLFEQLAGDRAIWLHRRAGEYAQGVWHAQGKEV